MAITKIQIDNLIPFRLHTNINDVQIYNVEELKQIISMGQEQELSSIIVRPIADGKHEIICGHNIVNAIKALGYNTINAVVKAELSDDEAKEIYYDNELTPKTFSDWDYSQKIEAIKYAEKFIKENSRQGKRTDLDEKKFENIQRTTSVQSTQQLNNQEITSVQKIRNLDSQNITYVQNKRMLESNSDRITTRDKMAKRLGISTSTLSKYRSIIKLPDDELNSIAQFLDQRKISFEIAYRVSQLAEYNVEWFIECANEYPNRKIDMEKLKALGSKRGISGKNVVARISKDFVKEIFISNDSMIIKCI